MPISITCTHCDGNLRAPDSAAGRKVKCPKCGGIIEVPEAEEEAIQSPKAGITTRRPEPEPAPIRRKEDPDEDEEDEDRSPRSRRRRDEDDDDDDDYEDRPRRRRSRRRKKADQGGASVGLGIASLSVGIFAFFLSWIPVFGSLACGIGLLLGIISLILAIRKGSGYGMPIAGTAINGISLAVSLVWMFVVLNAVRKGAEHLEKAAQQAQVAAKQAQQNQLEVAKQMQANLGKGGKLPATGELKLAGGRTEVNGTIVANDPVDPLRVQSRCKVFTVNMEMGKTYQIDMMSQNLDSFLRLESPEGQLLAVDDDGGANEDNLDARIVFNCTRAGVYRIVATTFDGRLGNFLLRITQR